MIRTVTLAVLAGLLAAAAPAPAQMPATGQPAPGLMVWFAARTLVPGDVVQADDLQARPATRATAGAIPADRPLLGQEMRRRISAGAPLNERDLGLKPVVRANAPVRVQWQADGIYLEITGRALEAGVAGDQIRVLNTATSRTVHGIVQPDGSVVAQGGEP